MPANRSIDLPTRLTYGAGSAAFAAKDAAFVNFVPFFYTQVMGLSGSLYGVAALIGQLSDAITDPIFGTLSDNARSRWGRRHPYMAAAIVPLALCFLFLFAPPSGMSQIGLFVWLAVVAVALRTFLTMFIIPHTALGAELSTDYEERSLIVSYRTALGWIAGIALPWAGLTYFFSRGEGDLDGRLLRGNYIDYGLMTAGLVIAVMCLSAWGTRRQIPHLPMPKQRRRLRLLDPLRDVGAALHNRDFRWVFAALLFIGISTGVSVTLLFYANTYFWQFSSPQIGLISLSSVVPTIVGFALLRPLVKRFEKKTIYVGAMLLMVLNGLWWIPGRLLGLLPPNGAAVLLALAILHQFILVISVMIQQTIAASIVADIVDEHEVETGERMDGVFFAAMGFSMKIPTGLGQFMAGVLIDVIAIPARAAPGALASDVLFRLGLVAGPLVSLSFLIPVVLLSRIRINRRRHAELRDILEERSASD